MTSIGKSITIKGDISGSEDIVIEGSVEGKIELPGNLLTVGENGHVRAEINAKTVVIVGRVSGNVKGGERIEIQSTGQVEGDVSAPKLVVAEGAVINGSISMTGAEARGGAKPQPSAPAKPAEKPTAPAPGPSGPSGQDVRKAG